MKTKLLTIISMSLLFTGMSFAGQQKGTMKDPRDGQTYKTVKIGKQVWMAENLNFKSGDSWCYNNSEQNCNEYGRLYSWQAALNACPSGWHLPTSEEFGTLISNVGGIETAGKMLKSTIGWKENKGKSGNGLDAFGFNVLPAGGRNYNGNFNYAGAGAGFWSATDYGESYAYILHLDYDYELAPLDDDDKDYATSVRCLRD